MPTSADPIPVPETGQLRVYEKDNARKPIRETEWVEDSAEPFLI